MNTYIPERIQPPKSSCSGMAGFSLIEMMISITIGLMIVAALIGVLTSNARSSKTNERTSELQSNGRYALDHLRRELRHADYRGYTWMAPNASALTITNECLESGATAGSFVNNLSQGIWGANDSNPYSGNCLSTGYLRGDVLVVRRVADTALTAPTTLVNGEIYFRSTFIKGEMFKASASATAATGAPNNSDGSAFGDPLADFLVQEYVYYIGNDDNNSAIPALRRLTLRGGAMVDEMVTSGIEHMQVQYGRTPLGSTTTQYYTADQITPSINWEDVGSVRIWLLARNSQPETGYINSTTYQMGDINYGPKNDNFRRQLFTTTIQVRNFHAE